MLKIFLSLVFLISFNAYAYAYNTLNHNSNIYLIDYIEEFKPTAKDNKEKLHIQMRALKEAALTLFNPIEVPNEIKVITPEIIAAGLINTKLKDYSLGSESHIKELYVDDNFIKNKEGVVFHILMYKGEMKILLSNLKEV